MGQATSEHLYGPTKSSPWSAPSWTAMLFRAVVDHKQDSVLHTLLSLALLRLWRKERSTWQFSLLSPSAFTFSLKPGVCPQVCLFHQPLHTGYRNRLYCLTHGVFFFIPGSQPLVSPFLKRTNLCST